MNTSLAQISKDEAHKYICLELFFRRAWKGHGAGPGSDVGETRSSPQVVYNQLWSQGGFGVLHPCLQVPLCGQNLR